MRMYETLHLVKGEDLNHHGTLFAARAAGWFAEAGFAAAVCECRSVYDGHCEKMGRPPTELGANPFAVGDVF